MHRTSSRAVGLTGRVSDRATWPRFHMSSARAEARGSYLARLSISSGGCLKLSLGNAKWGSVHSDAKRAYTFRARFMVTFVPALPNA